MPAPQARRPTPQRGGSPAKARSAPQKLGRNASPSKSAGAAPKTRPAARKKKGAKPRKPNDRATGSGGPSRPTLPPSASDARLHAAQRLRDAADARLLQSAWYAPLARRLPARADSLDQCHVWLCESTRDGPTLTFAVGDDPARPITIYGAQIFELRGEWDTGEVEWSGDAAARGAMSTAHEELARLRAEAVARNEAPVDQWMTPFTQEELSLIRDCVVMPIVLCVDEAASGDGGRSFDDFGFKLGERVEAGEGVDCASWRREILFGKEERALLRRAFQSLQMLTMTAT
jgi:hypothetical protein